MGDRGRRRGEAGQGTLQPPRRPGPTPPLVTWWTTDKQLQLSSTPQVQGPCPRHHHIQGTALLMRRVSPGIPGVPPVPGHSMPQATPPPAAPASSSTSSSKSTAAAAPRQSKSKTRAPSSAAAAPPQAPPTPAGHPALLPHAAYPYPPAPHHASTAAQARSGQPQIAPRPPAQAINNAVMQQYANAMQVQHGAMAYQQYAMLHQHNPALMSQMYAPQYDPQRNGGQIYPAAYAAGMYSNMYHR